MTKPITFTKDEFELLDHLFTLEMDNIRHDPEVGEGGYEAELDNLYAKVRSAKEAS